MDIHAMSKWFRSAVEPINIIRLRTIHDLWAMAVDWLGLAVFAGLGWALAQPLFPLRRDAPDTCFRLADVRFAIRSRVHEMLYKRVLSLMMGD